VFSLQITQELQNSGHCTSAPDAAGEDGKRGKGKEKYAERKRDTNKTV